jgi:hypothetical protein
MKGEPLVVSSCCCQACQRRSGSFVSVQAFYAEEQVDHIFGASTKFERLGESGKKITYHFCPACGSTVYWLPEFRPGKIAVAAGAFADRSFPPPERLVWTEQRHPWVQTPEGTKEYPRGVA